MLIKDGDKKYKSKIKSRIINRSGAVNFLRKNKAGIRSRPDDYATFYFAFVFFITVFYEHFLDDEKKKTISKNLPYALAFFIFAFALISVIYVFDPRLLTMPYEYLIFGFIATVPISGYMLWRKPRLAPKMIKVGIFSFFVTLTAEITAMMTGQWEWPGQYIATISTFGLVFPVEEFIFWIFLGAPAIVAYYEFSADDEK